MCEAFGRCHKASGFSGKPAALTDLILHIASYLINAGPLLKDGDTIGPDANTKILVRHEASRLQTGRRVYHLYFDASPAQAN